MSATSALRAKPFAASGHPDRISDQSRQWKLVVAAAGVLLGSRALGLLEHPTLLLFLAAYLLFRLLVEFVKPAAPLPGGVGLTAIQWACVGG